MGSSRRNHPPSRRAILTGIGGTLATVAGCAEAGSSSTKTATTTASPIASVSVQRRDLVVDTLPEAAIDRVVLVGPTGEAFDRASIPPGATRVRFPLYGPSVDSYSPGPHRVVIVRDGTAVAETTVDLEPAVSITGVAMARDRPELDWDRSDRNWRAHAVVTVKNAGTGPEFVSELVWRGDPLSRSNLRQRTVVGAGVDLPPGEETVIRCEEMVFSAEYGYGHRLCRDVTHRDFSVVAVMAVGTAPEWHGTASYDFDWNESVCNITIASRRRGE